MNQKQEVLMKKMILALAILLSVIGFVFAEATCARCGRKYYGITCPYCAGYSAGIRDSYSGENSSSTTCNIYAETKSKNPTSTQRQERNIETADCYTGYNDARKSASNTTTSSTGE